MRSGTRIVLKLDAAAKVNLQVTQHSRFLLFCIDLKETYYAHLQLYTFIFGLH